MNQPQKPKLKLVGADGNAFSILALAKRARQKAGWTDTQWQIFKKEAMSGDYDHLLQTCMEHFDVV